MRMAANRYQRGRRLAPFSRIGLLVLLVSIAVHAAQVATRTVLPILFVSNVLSLFVLRWRASVYARSGRPDFDSVIAAEMIVAFGVLSLILGITAAVVPLFLGTATLAVNDLTALAAVATPFLEGLATAGLAPFFAVLLRVEAHEASGAHDSAADMSSLAAATRDLADHIRTAHAALGELQEAAREASEATRALAAEVRGETNRLSEAFGEGEVRLRALGAAAGASGAEVAKLTSEATRLNIAVNDTGTMLHALGDLIESVERFVKPSHPAK